MADQRSRQLHRHQRSEPPPISRMDPSPAAPVVNHCGNDERSDQQASAKTSFNRRRRTQSRANARSATGRCKEKEPRDRRLKDARGRDQHEALVPFGPPNVDDRGRDQSRKQEDCGNRSDDECSSRFAVAGVDTVAEACDRHREASEQHRRRQRNSEQARRSVLARLAVRHQRRLREEEQSPQ